MKRSIDIMVAEEDKFWFRFTPSTDRFVDISFYYNGDRIDMSLSFDQFLNMFWAMNETQRSLNSLERMDKFEEQ